MSEQAKLGYRMREGWLTWRASYAAAVLSTVFIGALVLLPEAGCAAEPDEFARFAQPTPTTAPGQSVTLLPDGRWLFAGGEQAGVASDTIYIQDPKVMQQQTKLPPLSARLMHPRSAHTATVLPDGTVLILGGVGVDGSPVSAAEIFDPHNAEITVIQDPGLKPRSHHAATLLTDGYVLITGGISQEGKQLQDAELWNPDSQYAEPLANAMLAPRADHEAALLPSGKGLIWGGREVSGELLPKAEIYDPATAKFNDLNPADDTVLPPAYLGDAPPRIEASLPEPDANNVAVTNRIAVRFSKPLQVEGVTNQTVTLVGPAGAVSGKVVAAGSGLLIFFTPNIDLLPAATYTLFLQGLADRQGQGVPWSAFSFTTKSMAALPAAPIARTNAGDSSILITPPAAVVNTAVKVDAAKGKEPKDQKKPAREKEKQPVLQDDEFEDWIPGEHHRHGQWRVLGTKNEPRVSKMLAAATPLQAAARTTALSGRVARLNGRPIEGVRVSAGGISTLTDAQGRFLLTGLAAGMRELTVDGSGAISGGRHYAKHFIRVELTARRTTVLPQPIYLARMNPANEVSISSPADRELVITHPDIPGLELHIPKGTVLRTPDGKIVTKLSITPLPVDRVPFAVPEGFPVYFTVQPAGVFVDNTATGTAAGIRVVYPNYLNAAPGTRMTFWNYDPTGEGWQVYGQGTVSEDGKQVVPDKDVVQRNLMAFGYGLENSGNAPADGPPPGGNCTAGDPVDCATGLFLHQVTDVFVSDTIPIGVTRTYRQNDSISRDFGIGANHNYGMFLSNPTGAAVPNAIDVVLPDGGRLRFQKVPRHQNSWVSFGCGNFPSA